MDIFDFDGGILDPSDVDFDGDDVDVDVDVQDGDFDVESYVFDEQPFVNDSNITFGATDAIDRRNIAKSELLSELQDQRIYIPGGVSTDHLGGLTSYSGQKVEDAINSARDRGFISDSEYKELFSLLKEACRFQ